MNVSKLSKYLLSFEIGCLVLFITIVYLLGASGEIFSAFSYPSFGNTVIAILLILSGMSIYSIWYLGYKILYIKEHDILQKKWSWRFMFFELLYQCCHLFQTTFVLKMSIPNGVRF